MKKIVTYLLIVIIAGFIVRELLYLGLKKNDSGIYDKYNTIFLNKNKYETLILGSSRAETHFNCKIIDSVLQTNSYNIGIQGASLPFALEIFNAYLENSSFPKNIILNIDSHMHKCDNDTIFMFHRFFPYLKNRTLYNSLKERDKRFYAFKHIPYYSLPFMGDGSISNSFRGILNKPGKYDHNYFKGFTPVNKLNHTISNEWKFVNYRACNNRLIYNRLIDFISLCKRHHTNLYLVISPIYKDASNAIENLIEINNKIDSIANKHSISLLNYSTDKINSDSSLFSDPNHLNEAGAAQFIVKLTTDLNLIWKR